MFTSVTVDRLYGGTVYKLIGIGLTCSVIPFSLLMGIFALFGANTVSWNAKPIVGMWGLALSPVIGVLLCVVLTFVLGTACVVGLWVYSKFRPVVLWGRNFVNESDPEDSPGKKGDGPLVSYPSS